MLFLLQGFLGAKTWGPKSIIYVKLFVIIYFTWGNSEQNYVSKNKTQANLIHKSLADPQVKFLCSIFWILDEVQWNFIFFIKFRSGDFAALP